MISIKVYYPDGEIDFIDFIDSVKFDLDKGYLLAYRGKEFRSLVLSDLKKVIIKE